MEMEWIRPDGYAPYLALLALVPLLAGLWFARRRRRALGVLAEPGNLHRLLPGLRTSARGDALVRWLGRRAWLRGLLGAAAAALFGLAYVGPVDGYALVPAASRRIDVVVVLDTSRSMWTEDVAPSRLERAKTEISALLDAMRGERAGLIAFAGLSRSVAPLTRDVDTIRFFLERLSPDDNRKGGTDIGGALRLALERFEGGEGSNQAIVLVTDGEDLTGEGLDAAEEAAARGIEVHVLGMGTEVGGKIPDGMGGFVVDPDTQEEVVSRLESESLERITEATGGVYLQAQGRVLPLEELYRRAIQPMEGRDVVDGKERVPRDRYQWPLALAILAALLAGAMRDARRGGAGRGRGAVRAIARAARRSRGGAANAGAVLLALTAAGCAEVDEGVEPWDGTLGEAIDAMEDRVGDSAHDGALEIAERVLAPTRASRLRRDLDRWTRGASEDVLGPLSGALDAVGVAALTSAERAEVEFARGVVLQDAAEAQVAEPEAAAERRAGAREAFGHAVGAGGEARGAALEALATMALQEAEALRLKIPAVAQAAGLPPAPEPEGEDDGPDPIDVARGAYLDARGRYAECFAASHATDDARANSDLCIRRLRELDELEDQQDQQQDDPQDQDGESDESEEGDEEQDPSDEQEPSDDESDPSDQEGEESGEEPEDPSQADPDEELPDEPPAPDESEESEPGEDEEPAEPEAPDDAEQTDEQPEDPQQAEQPIAETQMTMEELERLLQRNKDYQENGEELRKEVRKLRKIETQRDW